MTSPPPFSSPQSNVDTIIAVTLYLIICTAFSLIYIFTDTEKFAVDFILRLNDTANLSFSL